MTDGEPETVVSASLQKIKRLKTQLNIFFFSIKSETSDSFVNHFDGHFAYLKTLDFYFSKLAPFIGRFPSEGAASMAVKGLRHHGL